MNLCVVSLFLAKTMRCRVPPPNNDENQTQHHWAEKFVVPAAVPQCRCTRSGFLSKSTRCLLRTNPSLETIFATTFNFVDDDALESGYRKLKKQKLPHQNQNVYFSRFFFVAKWCGRCATLPNSHCCCLLLLHKQNFFFLFVRPFVDVCDDGTVVRAVKISVLLSQPYYWNNNVTVDNRANWTGGLRKGRRQVTNEGKGERRHIWPVYYFHYQQIRPTNAKCVKRLSPKYYSLLSLL